MAELFWKPVDNSRIWGCRTG